MFFRVVKIVRWFSGIVLALSDTIEEYVKANPFPVDAFKGITSKLK